MYQQKEKVKFGEWILHYNPKTQYTIFDQKRWKYLYRDCDIANTKVAKWRGHIMKERKHEQI